MIVCYMPVNTVMYNTMDSSGGIVTWGYDFVFDICGGEVPCFLASWGEYLIRMYGVVGGGRGNLLM